MTGLIVLVVTLAVVALFAAWRAKTDGRFRSRASGAPTAAVEPSPDPNEFEVPTAVPSLLAETSFDASRGERATLVQFSTAFCAPCRSTRRILDEVTELVPGVAHVEIDAEYHLELVRKLGIVRTPTTIVLDADGAEHTRAVGAPTKAHVLAALGEVV
ncbi:TlpA family protein disulfide reductase [Nocardioides sp. Bht2]|uniref:TlpA family protein disulfide reductase n=1 Tax=Nocardioides sp. Bht2 TaxID=3392297 RepID=UPI0039B5A8D8